MPSFRYLNERPESPRTIGFLPPIQLSTSHDGLSKLTGSERRARDSIKRKEPHARSRRFYTRYKNMLFNIAGSLSSSDVSDLKYLCRDHIRPTEDIDNVRNAWSFIIVLENKNFLAPNSLVFLQTLLYYVGRTDLYGLVLKFRIDRQEEYKMEGIDIRHTLEDPRRMELTKDMLDFRRKLKKTRRNNKPNIANLQARLSELSTRVQHNIDEMNCYKRKLMSDEGPKVVRLEPIDFKTGESLRTECNQQSARHYNHDKLTIEPNRPAEDDTDDVLKIGLKTIDKVNRLKPNANVIKKPQGKYTAAEKKNTTSTSHLDLCAEKQSSAVEKETPKEKCSKEESSKGYTKKQPKKNEEHVTKQPLPSEGLRVKLPNTRPALKQRLSKTGPQIKQGPVNTGPVPTQSQLTTASGVSPFPLLSNEHEYTLSEEAITAETPMPPPYKEFNVKAINILKKYKDFNIFTNLDNKKDGKVENSPSKIKHLRNRLRKKVPKFGIQENKRTKHKTRSKNETPQLSVEECFNKNVLFPDIYDKYARTPRPQVTMKKT